MVNKNEPVPNPILPCKVKTPNIQNLDFSGETKEVFKNLNLLKTVIFHLF